MTRILRQTLNGVVALILGSGVSSVYALTEADFTNESGVQASSSEYELNLDNNINDVVVSPKGMTVQKTADLSGLSSPIKAGDVIPYQIEIDNIGLLALTNVQWSDPLIPGAGLSLVSGDTDNDNELDADETWIVSGNYTVTQSDIDSNGGGDGDIDNTVTVSTDELANVTDSVEVPVVQSPDMEIVKTVDQENVSATTTLNYQIELTNTGNQSLNGISVVDTLPSGSVGTLTGPLTDTGVGGVLDVDETWQYTITYPVSSAMILAGGTLVNSVTANSAQTSTPVSDTATTQIVAQPSFVLAKTVDDLIIDEPGALAYTITVENDGNAALTNLQLSDTLPDGSAGTLVGPTTDTGVVGSLDIGETWEFTGSYNATQADMDAGVDLVNTVTATTAETIAEGDTPSSATATTTIDAMPALTVDKAVDLANISAPGTLEYTILVDNTGNVALDNIVLNDTQPDGTTGVVTGPTTDTGTIGKLDVNEQWEYTVSYAADQADIDAGTDLTNTVTATSDQTSPTLETNNAITTITQSPSFEVTKTVDIETATSLTPLTYSIVVENTGNVSLTSVVANDTMPDGSTVVLSSPTGDAGVASVLDVGETWTYTAQYAIDQADFNAGVDLVNEVTVTTAEAGSDTAQATTEVEVVKALALSKTAVDTTFTSVGDVVNFELLVLNSGNVPLNTLELTDALADSGLVTCTQAQPFSLNPGQSELCTAAITVDAGDIAAGQVNNQAQVDGFDPTTTPIDADSNIATSNLLQIAPVATAETVVNPVSGSATTFLAASDDTDANGDIDVTTAGFTDSNATDSDNDGDNDTLVVANEGTWTFNDATGEATFTPQAGYTGDPTPVAYTVFDATGLESNSVLLTADYTQTAPVAVDDLVTNPSVASPSNPTTLNVLAANGGAADSDPENDLLASSVSFLNGNAVDTDSDGDNDSLLVAGEGQWTVDELGNVTFTPVAGFIADPTPVIYTVADATGLVSNQATITIEYPQTAPVAIDDTLLDQPLSQPVAVSVLGNDTDDESNIDPTTVELQDPNSGLPVTSIVVSGEGTWTVDAVTGDVTFTPIAGFFGDPAPVNYRVSDTTDLTSNWAVLTITYADPAALTGTVWLDENRDGVIDASEDRKDGWTLQVVDANGNVVATTVTDAMGEYSINGLSSIAYEVQFFNEQGVYIGSRSTNGPLVAGQTVNLPLPVDPGGVVYDSISRAAIGGVTLALVNDSGTEVDDACLAQNQQRQTTGVDGVYSFNLTVGQHSTCPPNSIYRLEIVDVPAAYFGNVSSIIRQEGASNCGSPELGCAVASTFDASSTEAGCTVDAIPGTSACEVQSQPDAPEGAEDTSYYTEFLYNTGDTSVILNHVPLDLRANPADIELRKAVNKGSVAVGSILEYTITVENTKTTPVVDVTVLDIPPAGFAFEPQSARLIRTGLDGVFDTSDDVSAVLSSNGTGPVQFGLFDLDSGEEVRITYLMRVGSGVVAGSYLNSASASAPGVVGSYAVTVPVDIISDPVLNQATLIGKVFHDRNEDGVQDNASATGVTLRSNYYGWNSLGLPPLPGRKNINEDPSKHAITVNMPIGESNRFKIHTREGSRIIVDEFGNVTEAHVGDKARGYNSQDIRVCSVRTEDVPTDKTGIPAADGKVADVLKIVISNHGVDEEGIPGVRLATVTGLLIETDAFGRYSIPDVVSGDTYFGQNFVLKVDPETLPAGTKFTTENPYVLRIVNNALNRINFGVVMPESDRFNNATEMLCEDVSGVAKGQSVEVKLGGVFFETNRAAVRLDQRGIVKDIIQKLKVYGSGRILIEIEPAKNPGSNNVKLATKRLKVIESMLKDELGKDKMKSVTVELDYEGSQGVRQ